MGAEVFNSYDCTIGISKLTSDETTESLSATNDIEIDNRGNKEVLPIIEVDVDSSTTLNSISNNANTITFSLNELSSGDNIVLDFNEQSYTLNDDNIIDDISLDGLLSLIQNEKTTFTFDFTGDITVTIKYDTYQEEEIYHYVQQFRIDESRSYDNKKPFNSNKKTDSKLTDVNYSFNITKMSTKWIDSDREFRIGYHLYNDYNYQEEYKYLIGVKFDRLDQFGWSNPNEIMKDNISGSGFDIITRNY